MTLMTRVSYRMTSYKQPAKWNKVTDKSEPLTDISCHNDLWFYSTFGLRQQVRSD
jgi:hypothetical protein